MTRKKKNPTILTMPPFPPLVWDGSAWGGRIPLNSWKGFQTRLGAYESVSADTPSDGIVCVCVEPAEPPPTETSRKQPPSATQADANRDFVDCERAIHDRIVQAVVEFYNSVVDTYIEYRVPDLPPALDSPDQLRGLIGLNFVHVLAEEKDGVCYIGCQFGCEWDEEHGLGVMTHGGDVVEVGASTGRSALRTRVRHMDLWSDVVLPETNQRL